MGKVRKTDQSRYKATVDENLNNEVAKGAGKTVRKVKYARVPTGAETCPFCLMLASRGAVYADEDTASHTHSKCNCSVVPVFSEEQEIEGYDKMVYYDMWKHPEKYSEESPDPLSDIRERISSTYEYEGLAIKQTELRQSIAKLDVSYEKGKGRRRSDGVEYYNEYLAKREPLSSELSDVSAQLTTVGKTVANAVKRVIGKTREIGCTDGKTASDYFAISTKRLADTVNRGLEYIPNDWIDKLSKTGMKFKRVSSDRSHFDPQSNTIFIGRNTDELSVVHEMMHAMDEHDSAFFNDSKAFFASRTAGKSEEQLRVLTKDSRYDFDEIAFDMGGKCIDPYAYKIYRDTATGEYTAFEVSSMGVEYLYRKPWCFVHDPEMLEYVLKKIVEV